MDSPPPPSSEIAVPEPPEPEVVIPEDQWVPRRTAAAQLDTSTHTIEKWHRKNEIPWRRARGAYGMEIQVPLAAVDERRRTGKPTAGAGQHADAPPPPSALPATVPSQPQSVLEPGTVAVSLETWERMMFNLGALADRGLGKIEAQADEMRELEHRATAAETLLEAERRRAAEAIEREREAKAEAKRLADELATRPPPRRRMPWHPRGAHA